MSKNKKTKNKKRFGLEWLLVAIVGAFIIVIFIPKNDTGNISFPDLHGLSYSADGRKLIVAVHDGLREYSNGKWSIPDAEKNDYMGFSATKDGFYSSGHPGPGSTLKNPLGIVKSTDNGKTIEPVALHGEVDFHALSVGYETEDIYVFTPEVNSVMENSGFYYSNDQANSWNQMAMNGVTGTPAVIIAHPSKDGVMAVGTDNGLYISNNYGESFEAVLQDTAVKAAVFTTSDEMIVGSNQEIVKLDLLNNNTTNYKLPENIDGNISFISNNFKNNDELAFATDQLNIYASKDNGETWEYIVKQGSAKNIE